MATRACVGVGAAIVLCALSLTPSISLADASVWKDPSPHRVRFVTVEEGIRLETLDWGGRGRPVILLAGGGNTAHVFDDFALKLTGRYHVYGITRRGSPPSSIPEDGYGADRMGEDIIAAIRELQLTKPVLIGHSFAGNEMSNVASRRPDLVAAAVYLDAAHTWDEEYESQGFYKIVEWKHQLNDFKKRLQQLVDEPFDSRMLARDMLETNLPQLQAILETLIKIEDGRPPRPDATAADLVDFRAVQAWYARNAKVVLPEAEFRSMLATDEQGRPTTKFRRPGFVGQKIDDGKRKYTNLTVPALAIFAVIDDPGAARMDDPKERANAEAYQWFQRERTKRQVALFRRDIPGARVVTIERADHYVYLSNESEVLKELTAFIDQLPRK